jgi:Ca2+/Na+ antiporter
LLLGLGIGFTLATVEEAGPLCLVGTTSLIMSFGVLLGSLAFTAALVPINGFSGGRWYGAALIAIYVCFLVANIAIEFV